MALLNPGPSYLILFEPLTIIPRLFISSFLCHLLSTGRLIGSNLMPSVPKFHIFADDNPLSGFYDCFDDGLSPLQSFPEKERNITSAEESSHGRDDQFFDCDPLEEPFNCIYLEYLINHTNCLYCLSTSPDDPSASNFPNAASCNSSLVLCIRTYINGDITGLRYCLPIIFDSGSSLSI